MINRILWVLLLASSLQTSRAYSLAGPTANGGDAWQVSALGYSSPTAPKNLGEEFRRNTPVMYYAYDANFWTFFGPEGAQAVDSAFAILNTVTNVDKYSKTLTEIPLETRQQNYQAQALGLIDLKSETLGLMMEQLGLTDPVRYVWALHDRYQQPGATCPAGMQYLVVQRNFDVTPSPLNQINYSPYVNNILYSYQIQEFCPLQQAAIAAPFSVDPLAQAFSPVASFPVNWGDYFTGLTRDDIAGLRYLLSTNNLNRETPASDSLVVTTNLNVQQLFPVSLTASNGVDYGGTTYGTASYGELLTFARTNDAATVQAAYPGLQLTLISNYFTTVRITNTISYYTNYYGEAIGTPAHLVVKTNYSTGIAQIYTYTFDNIITNIYSQTTTSIIQNVTVGPMIGAPIGSPSVTNVSTKKMVLGVPFGEFYILPTNSPCGLDIVSTLLTFTNYTTNLITSVTTTNNSSGTSTNTGTGTNTQSFFQYQVIPNIGHVYVIHPVTCDQSNAVVGLYQGVSQLRFVRQDYDSLVGQYWQPITNDYKMTYVTNSKAFTRYFRRIVTQPDFLFTMSDLTAGPADPPSVPRENHGIQYNTDNVLSGLAGPGTIIPTTTFTFNKVTPVYFNSFGDVMDGTPYFTDTPGADLANQYYSLYFLWASFDGSTNTPVVFPNGTSIENLQNQILIRVSPGTLPLGIAGVPYSSDEPVVFSATGGAFTKPYTWTATGLPDGLSLLPNYDLSGNPDSTATLTGTPGQSGTYDFTLTLTDQNGKSVQWTYTIIIQ